MSIQGTHTKEINNKTETYNVIIMLLVNKKKSLLVVH